MKLSRWVVVCAWSLCGLAPLVCAGWWLISWPTRTAREFIALWSAGGHDPRLQQIVSPRLAQGLAELDDIADMPTDEYEQLMKRLRCGIGNTLVERALAGERFEEKLKSWQQTSFRAEPRSFRDRLTGTGDFTIPLDDGELWLTVRRDRVLDMSYHTGDDSLSALVFTLLK